jgi:hypothetical protein
MTWQPEVSQKALRCRMGGATTRIGEPNTFERRQRFVSRAAFAAASRNAPDISSEVFRADQEATAAQEADDPFDR